MTTVITPKEGRWTHWGMQSLLNFSVFCPDFSFGLFKRCILLGPDELLIAIVWKQLKVPKCDQQATEWIADGKVAPEVHALWQQWLRTLSLSKSWMEAAEAGMWCFKGKIRGLGKIKNADMRTLQFLNKLKSRHEPTLIFLKKLLSMSILQMATSYCNLIQFQILLNLPILQDPGGDDLGKNGHIAFLYLTSLSLLIIELRFAVEKNYMMSSCPETVPLMFGSALEFVLYSAENVQNDWLFTAVIYLLLKNTCLWGFWSSLR